MSQLEQAHTEEDVLNQYHAGNLELHEAEPWEDWESKLVLWSIGSGLAGLVVLGAVINVFILN